MAADYNKENRFNKSIRDCSKDDISILLRQQPSEKVPESRGQFRAVRVAALLLSLSSNTVVESDAPPNYLVFMLMPININPRIILSHRYPRRKLRDARHLL